MSDSHQNRLKKKAGAFFRYGTLAVFLVCMQAAALVLCICWGARFFPVRAAFFLLTLFSLLLLIGSNISPAYKLCWAVPMLLFPMFGGIAYLLFNRQHSVKRLHRKMLPYFRRSPLRGLPPENGLQAYLTNEGFPAVKAEGTYFPLGEAMFQEMLNRIREAKRCIYLEFFLIGEGSVWSEAQELLARKAREGVTVRIAADGAGSLFVKPKNLRKQLERLGIEYREFNPVPLYMTAADGYRNHRKILVCDGEYAFCGGINLSDEYMNRRRRFGHWKDGGFAVSGEAARQFSRMAEEMWSYLSGGEPRKSWPAQTAPGFSGTAVQPFSDTPLDSEPLGLRVYLSLIGAARKSIRLTTPYLICSEEMLSALCFAAKRGVKVQIITPHIPDKKYVFLLTRGHYAPLIEAGAEIYEYTPGFIHAKNLLIDETTAVCGTINFDYRSMYLMFECGCVFYGGDVVRQALQDFCGTLALCSRISYEEACKPGIFVEISRAFLNFFAPLM